MDRGLPALRVPPRADQHRRARRASIWSLDPLDAGRRGRAARARARRVVAEPLDPLAGLVRAQRTAVALAAARGLDPDRPRNLTRSVVLAERDLELLS